MVQVLDGPACDEVQLARTAVQEARFEQRCIEGLAQLRILRLELRREVALVLGEDLVDDGDRVEGHVSSFLRPALRIGSSPS